MQVESLTVGLFASNCHFLVADGGRALVVDPGGEPERLLTLLDERGWIPAAYLLTHGHVDHVHALAPLHARYPAPIGLHPLDAAWAFTDLNAYPPYYDTPVAPPRLDRAWADGEEWTDAGLTYRVIETPGHSPGGVCFHFPAEKVLLAGDTLFQGSVGRTDLPGGDARLLAASLRKLLTLPDETVVYCGHGPRTTIGRERRSNPFLRGG